MCVQNLVQFVHFQIRSKKEDSLTSMNTGLTLSDVTTHIHLHINYVHVYVMTLQYIMVTSSITFYQINTYKVAAHVHEQKNALFTTQNR